MMPGGPADVQRLQLRPLGIETYRDFIVYMNRECPAGRAEGFEAQARRGSLRRPTRHSHAAHHV